MTLHTQYFLNFIQYEKKIWTDFMGQSDIYNFIKLNKNVKKRQ